MLRVLGSAHVVDGVNQAEPAGALAAAAPPPAQPQAEPLVDLASEPALKRVRLSANESDSEESDRALCLRRCGCSFHEQCSPATDACPRGFPVLRSVFTNLLGRNDATVLRAAEQIRAARAAGDGDLAIKIRRTAPGESVALVVERAEPGELAAPATAGPPQQAQAPQQAPQT